MMYLSFKYVGL